MRKPREDLLYVSRKSAVTQESNLNKGEGAGFQSLCEAAKEAAKHFREKVEGYGSF